MQSVYENKEILDDGTNQPPSMAAPNPIPPPLRPLLNADMRKMRVPFRVQLRINFIGALLLCYAGLHVFGSSARGQTVLSNLWTVSVGWVDSSPAIGPDGTVYVTGFQGNLTAVNTNGTIQWKFPAGSEIASSPAVATDGTIYFGSRDRRFYAVDPAGNKKWEFLTDGWVDSSPAVASDGTVYFGSWDNHLYALGPDGRLKWKFKSGGAIQSSAAIDGEGAIYFGSYDRKFYAVAPDGTKLWDFETGGAIISSPAIDASGNICFTSVDGNCYLLNRSGELVWRLGTGGTTESSPVIAADGTIYLGVNRSIWAITAEGKKKWHRPIPEPLRSTVAVFDVNSVGFSSPFRDFTVLNAEQKIVASVYLDSYTGGTPAVAKDGTLYGLGKHTFLHAVNSTLPLAKSTWPRFRGNARNTGSVLDHP